MKQTILLEAASKAIFGAMDIFLVGKLGESPIGNATNKWFENRRKDFAKFYGWWWRSGS